MSAAGETGKVVHAVFTNHFLGLSPERLADTLAGIDGAAIEAPVRPKGHVEPECVDLSPGIAAVRQMPGVRRSRGRSRPTARR